MHELEAIKSRNQIFLTLSLMVWDPVSMTQDHIVPRSVLYMPLARPPRSCWNENVTIINPDVRRSKYRPTSDTLGVLEGLALDVCDPSIRGCCYDWPHLALSPLYLILFRLAAAKHKP
jgi:hypothetical protein